MAKRTTDLPIHFRTGLRAVGVVAGRPVWPVLGGEESADAAAQAAARAAAGAAAQAAGDEKGFPENTTVTEMTPPQQAAYWKFQSRKHEGRVQSLGNLTAEQLADLRTKAQRADELELTLGTDTERAVAIAKQAAAAEAEAKYRPALARAEFKAAAVGRLDPAQLEDVMAPFGDMAFFLTETGAVDTAKVTAYLDKIAPVKGTQDRIGPSSGGTGRVGTSSAAGSSVSAGRDLYESTRKGKRSA